MQEQGILSVKTRGDQRFRILQRQTNNQGLISADVTLIPAETRTAIPKKYAACVRLLQAVVADQGEAVFAQPHALTDAAWVGYRLSEILPVPLIAKQKLLELTDSLERLTILQRFLEQRGLAGTEGGSTS
jgi:Lon protease-like protein